MALPAYPLINSNRYAFASIEAMVEGMPYRGVKSVRYKDAVERSKVWGGGSRPLGRTRGKYDPDGSIELFKEEATTLRSALAALGSGGWMEAVFTVVVSYAELGQPVVTDRLFGCMVTDVEDNHAQGADGLTETWTLSILEIVRNGVPALSPATR